jgi:uncharacterized protein (TIGR00299 family) protein
MNEPSRILIFDPFSGISGDMILGGLLDIGVPLEWLQEIVAGLGVEATLEAESVTRGSLHAQRAHVVVSSSAEQPVRHLEDVLEIIESAPVENTARETAAAAFRRLAEVEGEAHGLPPERVHFHEVGAADAIVDIIGAAAGVGYLNVDRCYTRPVVVGRGWVSTAHGRLPLPAPATMKLLEGIPVVDSEMRAEMTTPTGAVLLSVLTDGRSAPRSFVPTKSGFGAGGRDPDTHPNSLRLVLAECREHGGLYMIQADIDDMSPEYLPSLLEALSSAGATDVWTHPVQMKKGRTGIRLEALVTQELREVIGQALFENSTTLGFRFWPIDREVLPRTVKRIEWRGFSIRIKSSESAQGHVICKPEYDDITQAARALGLPPLKVREEIESLLESKRES